ncbi:MAG: hypothetical protein P4L69_20840 [Desulfosporosinus sp.]|nr:hypothetical protein [Desulfosporosinus sp.]
MPPKRAPKRKAPAKKRTQRGGNVGYRSLMTMHPQNGTGFFGDLWSGVKDAANFVKDNKLISKGLSLIPHPYGQAGSQIAGQLGFGKKRKRRTIKYT